MAKIITSVLMLLFFSFSIKGENISDVGAGKIPEMIQGLKGWDRESIQVNYEKLYQQGEACVPYLIEALKDEDPGLRNQAARLLGDLKAEEAIIPLGNLLDDPKYWVSRSAVFSLGRIGSPAVIPFLKKALKHYKPDVQEAALIGLGEIQDKSAIPDVSRLMVVADDQYVRWEAMKVLEKMEEGAAIEALVKTLDDKKAGAVSRRIAAEILGELKVKSALPDLLEAFSAKDAEIRWAAVEAVGKIGDVKAREAVEAMLNDKNLDVKMFAIGALGSFGRKESITALSRLLSSKTTEVRKNTIRSLRKIGGSEAIKYIRKALRDSDDYIRVQAIETLAALYDVESLDEIKLLASDRSPSIRTAVMHAMGKLNGESCLDILRSGKEDKNYWVKSEAERALEINRH